MPKILRLTKNLSQTLYLPLDVPRLQSSSVPWGEDEAEMTLLGASCPGCIVQDPIRRLNVGLCTLQSSNLLKNLRLDLSPLLWSLFAPPIAQRNYHFLRWTLEHRDVSGRNSGLNKLQEYIGEIFPAGPRLEDVTWGARQPPAALAGGRKIEEPFSTLLLIYCVSWERRFHCRLSKEKKESKVTLTLIRIGALKAILKPLKMPRVS